MIDMIHTTCGGVAFVYKGETIDRSRPLLSTDYEHLDGSPIYPLEPMKCGTCGRYTSPNYLTYEGAPR